MRKITPLLALALWVSGCASAGPVVSNISYDASGALSIEKCKVHTNFFLGTMELEECSTHLLNIATANSTPVKATGR